LRLLAAEVIGEVVAGFVAEDEGDLVGGAGLGEQCGGDADDRAAVASDGLEGVRRGARVVDQAQVEIAEVAGTAGYS
jgi:hypothetical protein